MEQFARVCEVPPGPDSQWLRLAQKFPENGTGVEVDRQRWSLLSRSIRKRLMPRLSLTPGTRLRSGRERVGSCTTNSSFGSVKGTSLAMGVLRSQTTTVSPRRTRARYWLRWALSSAIWACRMDIFDQ